VKGLVAVVVGLAGLWILGWVLSLLGGLLLGLAGIIVALLRWLVPIALIVGIVYFAATQLQPKPSAAPVSAAKPEDLEPTKSEVVEADGKVEAQTETSEQDETLVEEPNTKDNQPKLNLLDEGKKDE
jgi:predicted lipid-binding transport protein (Tim44 family)